MTLICNEKVNVIQDERQHKKLKIKKWLSIILLAGIGLAGTANALPNLPAGFSTQLVANNLNGVVAFDFAAGNRIFVATKDGRVRVVVDGVVQPGVFANYSQLVNNQRDRGLLGIAVHPDFPGIPYVYLLMTYDPIELAGMSGPAGRNGTGNRVARLIRLEADPANDFNAALGTNAGGVVVDPTYETILLGSNSTFANIGDPAGDRHTLFPSCDDNGVPIVDCMPADEITHTIGTVKFGIDGSLYVSNGDGSGAVGGVNPYTIRSQNLDSLAGKILRIHPLTGEAYADNPWFDGDFQTNRSKVWNYGLRNPFRFTIDKNNGELWIGDVGWGLWEEINTGSGKNFGWPCYEGALNFSAPQPAYDFEASCQALNAGGLASQITAPVYAYDHSSGGASVQMGDFYNGPTWPANYQGMLFYSDINRRIIDFLEVDSNGNLIANHNFATNATGITQIQSGPDTNLYYSDIYGGEIRRIVYTAGGNTPPTAIFNSNPLSGQPPLTIDVDATASFDPDADPLTYTWYFGDGTIVDGPVAQHVYTTAGSYNLALTVTDDQGASTTSSELIVVGNSAPTASIASVTNGNGGNTWTIGDPVIFNGLGSDPEDGTLSGDALTWNVTVEHNDHVHLDYYNGVGDGGQFDYLDHEDNSFLRICLTVTDSGGLQGTDCQSLYPEEVAVTINSIPPGLTLTFESTTAVTPFTVTTPVGASRSIVAPTSQGNFSFQNWSDGGAGSHVLTIPAVNTTYTATYSNGGGSVSCGQPGYDLNSDQGVFLWSDCNTGRWTVHALSGGSATRVTATGRVESDLAFDAIGTFSYEPQFGDNVDFSTNGRIDYLLHAKNAGFDEFWFDLADSATLCFGLEAAVGSQVLLGPQALAYDLPINPITLASCSGTGINALPVINAISDQTSNEGDNVSLLIQATDSDLDPITFSASNLPAGVSISSTGLISGVVASGSIGSYTVTVNASDGTGSSMSVFQWTISPSGTVSICGQPSYDPAVQAGTFLWSDCATGRYYLHGSDGGSTSRVTHAGNIDSSAAFADFGTEDYEPQYGDLIDTSTPGRISYLLHTKNGRHDGLWFDVNAGESVCIGLDQAAGSTVYVGAQSTPMTLPIDPVTLASCSSPLNTGAPDYCYAPALDPSQDSGMFIWKNCGSSPETWHIRTAAGGSASAYQFNATVTSTSGTLFQSVNPVSFEGSDWLVPANVTTQFSFMQRMIGAGFDGVDFEIPTGSDVCLDPTTLHPGTQVYVGANRIPKTGAFDIETLGNCQ